MILEYTEQVDNSLEGVSKRLWKKLTRKQGRPSIFDSPIISERIKQVFFRVADIVGFSLPEEYTFEDTVFPVLTSIALVRGENSRRGGISFKEVRDILSKLGYTNLDGIMDTFDFLRSRYMAVKYRNVDMGAVNSFDKYRKIVFEDQKYRRQWWQTKCVVQIAEAMQINGGMKLIYTPVDFILTMAVLEEVEDPLEPLRGGVALEKLASFERGYTPSERRGLRV